MASARFAWGIDIGNRALKAVKLVRDGDALRVDDFELIEHETILSQAGDNREQLVQTALANFVQRHNFKGGVVSVGVSGQASFARFVKLPPVEEKKIPQIVRFEAIQQIPFPLEDVEWSYQLFRTPDNPEVEVGIFAMRRELVNQHIKHFTDFDLNVQTVQMNPLAVYNALQADGRFNDGTAMVIDVGTDNTDLIIADNDSIWMRSIPIGGSNFTEALVKSFKLNFVKAEDLKRNAATSKYARQIFQHMRPVFADLVAEIQRSIGFYSSVHRDAKLTKIFALGGTFKLPGLQKYLQQNLQMPVERLDSVSAGAPADPKLAATFGDNLLSVVGAYGLAIQAMGAATVNSSLLPRSIQHERMWQEKNKWFGLAAALFVGGVTVAGAVYFLNHLQKQNHDGIAKANAAVLQQAKANDAKWATVSSAGGDERATIANLQLLVEGKYLVRDLLGELIATMPQPPEPLATALQAGNVDEIKKVPRAQRPIITVDEIVPRYEPMLVSRLTDPTLLTATGAPGAPAFAPPPGADGAPAVAAVDPTGKGRGYVILMRVTCPLAQSVAFIEGDVQKRLMSIAPSASRPNMKYAVRMAKVLKRDQIIKIQSRLSRLEADYNAANAQQAGAAGGPQPGFETPPGGFGGGFGGQQPGGFGGGFNGPPPGGFGGAPGGFGGAPSGFGAPQPGAGGPVLPADNPAFKDRITGESVLGDWEFEIAVCVELDPAAYVAPEAAPAVQAASAE
ncbi:MAG TPA: type IV pilus assembly protein PilM [Tepidisphaeraceae bacterium]|jgi:type IV pilus assembly protein PilM